MSLEIIKQKINNGEGFIQMENAGLIPVKDMDPNDNIVWKPTKKDYKDIDDINNPLVLKTKDDYKQDKYRKIQSKLLNDANIAKLIDAMHKQITSQSIPGIKIENKMFTDTEITDWLNWYYGVANNAHNLSGLTLEEIDESLFGIMPDIPELYKNITL